MTKFCYIDCSTSNSSAVFGINQKHWQKRRLRKQRHYLDKILASDEICDSRKLTFRCQQSCVTGASNYLVALFIFRHNSISVKTAELCNV